jgi:HSP20 family protein
MQSQAIQQPEKKNATSPLLVEAEKLLEQMKDFSQSVAHRAYQFFEARGRELGHELEDWFRAEAELLRPIPVEVRETEKQFIVRAEAPGFKADEIQVSVEPKGLIISGKSVEQKKEEAAEKVYSEFRSQQFCRRISLAAEVDPAQTTATLSNGVLELTLTKAAAPEAVSVDIKTA